MLDNASNFLTIDVEEWFEAEIIWARQSIEPVLNSILPNQIDVFLRVCNKHGIKATCFISGKIADRFPDLVRRLSEDGHEIASHSYDHRLVYTKTQDQFREDLRRSVGKLESITSKKILGYRAPSWSVNSSVSDWFYAVLHEVGLAYSSSVYPAKTYLYGMPEAPSIVHRIPQCGIVEIPQQLLSIGPCKFGFAGGAFMRILPAFIVKKAIKHKNEQGKCVFIYVHPWELIEVKHDVKLTYFEHFIQTHGIKNNEKKLNSICKQFSNTFVRMGDFVSEMLAKRSLQ